MSIYLRVVLFLATVIYFMLLLHFMKRKMLTLKYTLLWIAAGVAMGMLVLFPGLLSSFTLMLGVQLPVNGLTMAAMVFVICILMSLTSIVSLQNEKIKNLAQEIAMYEKRLREQEQEIKQILEKI